MTAPSTVHGFLLAAMEAHAGSPAQRALVPGGEPEARTHAALRSRVLRVARGLITRGVQPGDRVGLIADNGPWWLAGNLGILAAGGVDVPRGSDSPPSEIAAILAHAEVRLCLAVGEEATRRVLAGPPPFPVVRLDGPPGGDGTGAIPPGEFFRGEVDSAALPPRGPEDVASVIYTSGTTGRPKGVTLLHRNFLHQLEVIPSLLDIRQGDVFLAMLPPWHCFERIVEYMAVATGSEVVHSSPRTLARDIPAAAPTWMASVPRVWEMILSLSGYRRLAPRDPERAAKALRAALGGRLRCAVSGGGRIPDDVDRTYNEAGVRFLVGYGLTETAPVLTVRRPEANPLGTIGKPVPGTEIRIVDRETGRPLPAGGMGVVQARGPQVMRGYWKDPELTARVLDGEGWFDTGDLGSLTEGGDLEFRGRAKDTLVLRGGENVEPARLEDRLAESPLIAQALVLGNDEKALGALLVPQPEALAAAVKETGEGAEAILRGECARLLTEEAGFAAHERVARVLVLGEPFTVENGLLTATLKVRRAAVLDRYAEAVRGMFGA